MPPRSSWWTDAREFLARNVSRVPIVGGAVAREMFRAESSADPYGGHPSTPANIPRPDYATDQPPAVTPESIVPGYHDRAFRNMGPPTFFGGITIDVAREYVELHDSGTSFLGTSMLSVAVTRFAPVQAALWVRVAPLISLPRQIVGGSRGLARIVREEVESQVCPRTGLLPSPCFPSYLWGSIAIDLALMGFAVLQHVYGPPDARGVRRVYTRRWPTWAVYYQAWRRTYVALTTEGPIDILNDGKFTLIGKTDTPHLQGAIRALALPVLDGVQVMQARAEWIDVFAQAKGVATMPEGVSVRSPEGLLFLDAIRILRGPGGIAGLPHGSDFKFHGLSAEASTCFKDALSVDDTYIAAILTGTDLSAGTGGVYKAPVFWGILRSTVGDDLSATVRGVNAGHVYPYTRFNYADAIETAGGWEDPALSIPLPDPERAQRAVDYAAACKAHTDTVKARRDAGYVVTQDDSDKIAEALGLDDRPVLSPVAVGKGEIFQYHITEKQVATDEVRGRLGFDPLPNGAGSVERLAEERLAGKDKTGAAASLGDATIDGKPPTAPPDAEPADTGSEAGADAPASGNATAAGDAPRTEEAA